MEKKTKGARLPRETTFLSGPIDGVADYGVGWRKSLKAQLAKLNIRVIDPIERNTRTFGVHTPREIHMLLEQIEKERGEEEFLLVFQQKIVKDALRTISRTDFLTVNWDMEQVTVGTIHEIVFAAERSIPVYLICHKEKRNILPWLRYLIAKSGGMVFQSFDEYLTFLRAREVIRQQTYRKLFLKR